MDGYVHFINCETYIHHTNNKTQIKLAGIHFNIILILITDIFDKQYWTKIDKGHISKADFRRDSGKDRK